MLGGGLEWKKRLWAIGVRKAAVKRRKTRLVTVGRLTDFTDSAGYFPESWHGTKGWPDTRRQ